MTDTEFVYRRLVDGGLVYDEAGACIHHLNETAAFIWEAWQAGESVEAIAGRLCARYDVDTDTARREAEATVCRFEEGLG